MPTARPLVAALSLLLPVALTTTLTAPAAEATIVLTRDPVAFLYNIDHRLSLDNNHVTDDDLSFRTQKLTTSPWVFFRGTSPLYYRDLGQLPASAYAGGGNDVWIMGDAHLENSGADRGADNVEQYQTTDFDDAWRGSYTWELRREAVSIVLAGRQQGRSASDINADVNTLVSEYRQYIQQFHGTSDELTFRLTSANTSHLSSTLIAQSAADTRLGLLDRWSAVTNGVRRFKADPELVTVPQATRDQVVAAIAGYRTTATNPFTTSEAVVKDVRRRIHQGTGSLGRYRWYVLLEGKTTGQDDDRIMELKQTRDAAPQQLNPTAVVPAGGERVAKVLRWEVNQSDQRAGWASVGTVPVSIKEKSPYAEGLDITAVSGNATWDDTVKDIARCLAAGQSRADQDTAGTGITNSADAQIDNAITSLPGLQAETVQFANDYADQVTRDWQAYVNAYNSGQQLY